MSNLFESFNLKRSQVPQVPSGKKKVVFSIIDRLTMRLSLNNRIMFIKQLAILVKSGVPLLTALHMLKDQSTSRVVNNIMDQAIYDVENGQDLSVSFGKFKRIFGELTINIIAIGEMSGTLSDNLGHLVDTLKKEQNLRRKVIAASVYPIFIVVATLVITIMLTAFFFPKIVPLLKSINYNLPWSTRTLIFVSDLLRNYGALLFIGFILFLVGIYLLLKIKKVRYWYDTSLVTMPPLKKLVQVYNMA